MAELQKSVNDDPEDDIEEWSIRYGTFLDCNVPTPCKFSSNDSYALLKHPPKVISGGGNHPALITYNGELWMSGSNIDHQCGKLMSNDPNLTKYGLNVAKCWARNIVIY
ncbi:12055_t:CDS:2 [Entrophospora sp. SA101]|nr:12055_t:CDS:2 [Entrophospora sp. SA101]